MSKDDLTPENLQQKMASAAQAGISPEDLARLKDQLLICLVNRLGGKVELPVAEVDTTGGYWMPMSANNGVFTLEVKQKQ